MMFDAYIHTTGVVHLVGRHLPSVIDGQRARVAYAECGVLLHATSVTNGPAWFLQPNTTEFPNCIACLVESKWGTYAPDYGRVR